MHNKQHMIHVANVAQHAGHLLKMQPGSACSPTDVAMLGNLKNCHVEMACKHRCCALDHGIVSAMAEPTVVPDIRSTVYNTFHMPAVAKAQLVIHDQLPIIGIHTETIVLFNEGISDHVDIHADVLKRAVAERHHGSGHIGLSSVKGYGLHRGAVVTSLAHDARYVFVCGTNDNDWMIAMNHIHEIKDNMTVVEDGQVNAQLSLPISGLFSDRPLENADVALERCKQADYDRSAHPGVEPFMTLCFSSLPNIPHLRLTTLGVFDVDRLKLV